MSQALLPGMPALPEYGDEHDFYSSPPEAIVPVLPLLPRLRTTDWNVLEPAAGEGAMLRSLLPALYSGDASAVGHHLTIACEIHPGRHELLLNSRLTNYCIQGDFLKDWHKAIECAAVARRVETSLRHGSHAPWLAILNPPYSKPYEGIGLDFVERCLEIAETVPGSVVAALLPLDFATGVDRCKRVHDRWKGSLYPLRRRQDFGGPHGSGQRPVAWFVFDLLEPKNEYRVIG